MCVTPTATQGAVRAAFKCTSRDEDVSGSLAQAHIVGSIKRRQGGRERGGEMTQQKENIAKLPKWAQEHIRVLEMRLREANLTITSMEGASSPDQASRITYRHNMDAPKALRMGTRVCFSLGPHFQDKVEVGFGNGGALEIHTNNTGLVVRPQANNKIILEIAP